MNFINKYNQKLKIKKLNWESNATLWVCIRENQYFSLYFTLAVFYFPRDKDSNVKNLSSAKYLTKLKLRQKMSRFRKLIFKK